MVRKHINWSLSIALQRVSTIEVNMHWCKNCIVSARVLFLTFWLVIYSSNSTMHTKKKRVINHQLESNVDCWIMHSKKPLLIFNTSIGWLLNEWHHCLFLSCLIFCALPMCHLSISPLCFFFIRYQVSPSHIVMYLPGGWRNHVMDLCLKSVVVTLKIWDFCHSHHFWNAESWVAQLHLHSLLHNALCLSLISSHAGEGMAPSCCHYFGQRQWYWPCNMSVTSWCHVFSMELTDNCLEQPLPPSAGVCVMVTR